MQNIDAGLAPICADQAADLGLHGPSKAHCFDFVILRLHQFRTC